MLENLCKRDQIEFEVQFTRNRKRYSFMVIDSPDTMYTILGEFQRTEHAIGSATLVIETELAIIFSEIDKHLCKYKSTAYMDELLKDRVRMVNITHLIPIHDWFLNGIHLEYGWVPLKFIYFTSIAQYVARQMRQITEEYATNKGIVEAKFAKRKDKVDYWIYPYKWATSKYYSAVHENHFLENFIPPVTYNYEMNDHKKLTQMQAVVLMRNGLAVRVPGFDGYYKIEATENSIVHKDKYTGHEHIELGNVVAYDTAGQQVELFTEDQKEDVVGFDFDYSSTGTDAWKTFLKGPWYLANI